MRRQITGFSNPTVKYLRSLRDKKHRKREGKFLAEGLRLLTDARESGRLPEMLVMADKRDPHPLLAALEAEVERAGGEVIETSEDILAKITGKDNPQAVAVARWEEFLPWLRGGPGQLVAASLRDAVPYREAAYAAPCFILVGNESRGLPEEYEAECDLRVTMPMRGRADSLNAAVAGAVLAYEVLARLAP